MFCYRAIIEEKNIDMRKGPENVFKPSPVQSSSCFLFNIILTLQPTYGGEDE